MPMFVRRMVPGLVTALLLAVAAPASAQPPSPEGIEFFEKEIRPLLIQRCYECHGNLEKVEGGLSLFSRGGLLTGGETGPAAVPGKPAESLLVEAIHYRGPEMPPKGKLPEADIARLEHWIEIGLPWPDNDPPPGPPIAPESTFQISAAQRQFWSFQPIASAAPPTVQDAAWPAGDIDRFILAGLEARGLRPNPPADKRTLLRRATFDLIGLPPTPEEIRDFLVDESPDAWEKALDRLLASPHYGERWGRHWLDVVRYADTAGETADFPVPEAYKYRNYVIDSFQQDKPYAQFIREQVAGDILAQTGPRERYAEQVTATGYLAISRRFGFDPQNYHHLTIADTLDTLGRSVLGLSIGCARCHDHKYDPVSMADYYALYGIFASSQYAFPGSEERKRPADFVPLVPPAEAARLAADRQEQLARLESQPQRDQLAAQPLCEVAYGVIEGTPQNAKIQKRGEPAKPGAEAPRGFLEILGGDPLPPSVSGSGRLELAEWLTRPTNPLTARVMVNRIWQHHFGQGLVQTPSDFGIRGRAPTHPELLDYMAARFIDSGWSIKSVHKQIMLSREYQMSSRDDDAGLKADPANELVWRFNRRRLDAECIRDAILAASGRLDRSRGMQHPFPPVNTWGFTQHNPFKAVYDTNQRSVYLMVQRAHKHPFLALFDGADPNTSTADRSLTTTPTQALYMMNDPFVHEQSAALAGRLLSARADDRARIELAYELALAREPAEEECQAGLAFLEQYRRKLGELRTADEQQPLLSWAAFSRVLLTSNEFLYID